MYYFSETRKVTNSKIHVLIEKKVRTYFLEISYTAIYISFFVSMIVVRLHHLNIGKLIINYIIKKTECSQLKTCFTDIL